MIVSDQYKFVFVHVPKSGGISCRDALRRVLKPSERREVRRTKHVMLKEGDYKDYFKFGFVRNPWDRLVSFYHFLKLKTSFDLFVKGIDRFSGLYSMRAQSDYLTGADFVGRYERLEKDFKKVCDKLKISTRLRYLNKSKHRPYQEYYNVHTQELVRQKYQKDIETFNYSFI